MPKKYNHVTGHERKRSTSFLLVFRAGRWTEHKSEGRDEAQPLFANFHLLRTETIGAQEQCRCFSGDHDKFPQDKDERSWNTLGISNLSGPLLLNLLA